MQAGDEGVDARSDIFSVGLVLYEMLTGKRAIEGASPASLIAAIMERPAPSLAGLAPAPLDRVLKKCLEKDREERWQNVRDLKTQLLWATETVPGVSAKKERTPWIVAAAMALVAGAGLLYGFHGSGRAAGPPPNSVPVIVLMDTTAPNGVYDPKTRKNSGTNADDISDGLRDLPVSLHKETVSSSWDREDQILKQVPDLIVMHRSAFVHPIVLDFELASASPDAPAGPASKSSPDTEKFDYSRFNPIGWYKFDAFLGYVGNASPRTRFLIYSRNWESRHEWEQSVTRRFPELRGRVFTLSIRIKDGTASFRDAETIAQVKQAAASILNLKR